MKLVLQFSKDCKNYKNEETELAFSETRAYE